MKSVVKRFLGRCDRSVLHINRLLVSAYIRCRGLIVDEESILGPYIINDEDDNELKPLCVMLNKYYAELNLEDLIDFFEFVISPSDKVVSGAIYTPKYIREKIVNHVMRHLNHGNDMADLRIADIACGCGGFFLSLCEKIHGDSGLSFHYIYSHILYGCDVEAYCIERSKILLSLKALEEGERTHDLVFNLFQGNSLNFVWSTHIQNFNGFDAIVGNPPYVTSSKISKESKSLLDNWEVCASGKTDLYIPFLQIAIELLNETGIVGYITVSNFFRSLNGRALRNYLAARGLNLSVVDFGSEQVFRGSSTYTCLCFVDRQMPGEVRYIHTYSSSFSEVQDLPFLRARYPELDNEKGWLVRDNNVSAILRRIEHVGPPLGAVANISNGIATLKNDLFVLDISREDDLFFVHKYNGKQYLIERKICRQVVKPSSMNPRESVEAQTGWIIFPYEAQNGRMKCLEERRLAKECPKAYAYLLDVRAILNKRDKGKGVYEQWYAYGRSQAINIHGFRLLMPYIANIPTFILSDNEELLYYNGFALIGKDLCSLRRIQKILETSIFWFYVMNTSKPYANGYYSMGKRYLRYFGIPSLSSDQWAHLDELSCKEEIEDFLYPSYFGEDYLEVKKIIEKSLTIIRAEE